MASVNEYFLRLPGSYLFSDIAKRVSAYQAANPERKLIRLGIGDVTRPLPPACIQAMHQAVEELASADTFHGYGPEQGYSFLAEAIIRHDYASRGIDLTPSEVFISDGAKSDTGNISELLNQDCNMGVTDPVYPVYVDSNIMSGRAGTVDAEGRCSRITYLPCTAANGFIPQLPEHRVELIYLCYPNNPTGTTLTHEQLKKWVDYALENDALIIFDAAYEAYIQENNVPHSIYEIEDARKVAIEIRSFSKTAGFTGVRCGYTIVPREVTATTADGRRIPLNPLWLRRQCTKFNGASYITQRGAAAIYTPEGQQQIRDTIRYYMENARILRENLQQAGLEVYGGVNAPYIWLKTPDNMDSWKFFETLLQEVNLVSTPGVGFGPSGEGYLRLTAFGRREDCTEAMRRIRDWMG